MLSQESHELQARELAPLIGIEDLGRAIAADGVLHGVETELGRQRVGESPHQDSATGPVEHREEIHKAPVHGNVGDIGGPDLIWPRDDQVAQEIGINPMAGLVAAKRRLAIQGINPHAAHQRGHLAPTNGAALLPQEIAQHARPGKGILQMQLVDPSHQRPASAGNRRSSGPASGVGIAAGSGVNVCDRSWLCAPQARLDERPD